MKHLFSDPSFPDIVGEWADEESRKAQPHPSANDNKKDDDPLIALVARAEVEATRIW